MENLNIGKTKITWEKTSKNNCRIKYKNEIIRHVDHISIHKTMYSNGNIKRTELTHIPIELIDKIKDLVYIGDYSDEPGKLIFLNSSKEMEIKFRYSIDFIGVEYYMLINGVKIHVFHNDRDASDDKASEEAKRILDALHIKYDGDIQFNDDGTL